MKHCIESGPSKDVAITLQNAFDGQHILGIIPKLSPSVEVMDFVDRLRTWDRQRLLIWTFQLFLTSICAVFFCLSTVERPCRLG